jgi:5'(3')-deoxyribonucleotidase
MLVIDLDEVLAQLKCLFVKLLNIFQQDAFCFARLATIKERNGLLAFFSVFHVHIS